MNSGRRRAFTLIELMIVVAILGVLVVNVPYLMLPRALDGFQGVARMREATEVLVELGGRLERDLETLRVVPASADRAILVLEGAAGERVSYLPAVPGGILRTASGPGGRPLPGRTYPAVSMRIVEPDRPDAPWGAVLAAAGRWPQTAVVSLPPKEVAR